MVLDCVSKEDPFLFTPNVILFTLLIFVIPCSNLISKPIKGISCFSWNHLFDLSLLQKVCLPIYQDLLEINLWSWSWFFLQREVRWNAAKSNRGLHNNNPPFLNVEPLGCCFLLVTHQGTKTSWTNWGHSNRESFHLKDTLLTPCWGN